MVPEDVGPFGCAIDILVRVDPEGNVTSASATRQELANIMAQTAAEGELSEHDREYAVQLIAARTGLEQSEAEARIDSALASMEESANAAVENARKVGILITFFTATTMAVSGAAAWWAGGRGGRHRDEGTHFLITMTSRPATNAQTSRALPVTWQCPWIFLNINRSAVPLRAHARSRAAALPVRDHDRARSAQAAGA